MEPATKEAILRVAERHAQQGNLDAALDEYRKILRAEPRDVSVANTVGDLYARFGRTEEAIRHYLTVAGIFEAEGFLSKAAAMYKKIAKLDANNSDAVLQLAGLYARQNLMREAHQQYVAVAEIYRRTGRPAEAIRMLEKIVELAPANTRVRMDLGYALEREGRTREASEAFRAAGQEWLKQEKLGESIVAFKKALDLEPQSRGALKALTEAYARQGDVESALDVVARALEDDPNDIDLIIILGRTFLHAGLLDKAASTFERLFRLDNSRYDYLLEVARAYIAKGNYERAMSIVDECIDVMLARRHKKKATAILKSILEKDPDNVPALKRLSGIYRTVRERRNLVNTLNTLVRAALDQGLRSEAATALKLLVEIEPKKKAYQDQLASIDEEEAPAEPKGLALFDEDAAAAAIEDDYDSYGDYSTELLEEMVTRHPEFMKARTKLLEELVGQQPSYLDGRLKLRQLYLDAGDKEKAAAQDLEIARIYDEQGNAKLASQFRAEAALLRPEADGTAASGEDGTATRRAVRLSEMPGVGEFRELLKAAWRRAAHDRKPLSLAKIGVDDFDALEEANEPADVVKCLERVAGALLSQVSKVPQSVATDGTGEFYLLLPETHPGPAGALAENIRKAVEASAAPGGPAVTVSMGVATAFPHRADSANTLITSVGAAFTTARANGGNRVVTVPILAD